VFVTQEELLQALGVVLSRQGKLTAAIINHAPELPSANTVEKRFGSLVQAYERLGYQPRAQYAYHAVKRRLGSLADTTAQAMARAMDARGAAHSSAVRGLITLASGATVQVLVSRFQQPKPWLAGWRIAYQRNRDVTVIVALRMQPDNQQVLDVLVVPTHLAASDLPLVLQTRHKAFIAPFRQPTLMSAVLAVSRLVAEQPFQKASASCPP
jgi:hypothetical protein